MVFVLAIACPILALRASRYTVPHEFSPRLAPPRRTAPAEGEVRIFDGHKLIVHYDKREYGAHERVPVPKGRRRDNNQVEPSRCAPGRSVGFCVR